MSTFEPRPSMPHDPAIDAAMQLMHELDAEKTDGPVRANWIGRMIARLIDFAIVFACVIVIIAGIETTAVVVGADLREPDLQPTTTGTAVAWGTLVALVAFGATYEILLTWLRSGTPGKRRTRLRVVSVDGSRVSLRQAATRFATWGAPLLCCCIGWAATFPRYPVPSLVFFLGAFASLGWVAWTARDAQGRGIHDRVAGTKVLFDK